MHAAHIIDQLLVLGSDILSTTLDAATNVIRAQIGDSVAGVVERKACEWWQHVGFMSRPATPESGQSGAQCIGIRSNDADIIIASRDVRGAKIAGNMKDGETCVYASSGQARTLYKANGTVVDYTTSDNTADGQTHSVSIGPDGFHVVTKFGGISIDSTGITITSGGAALTLTADGAASIQGQRVSVQGLIALLSGSVATCLGPKSVPTPGAPGPNSVTAGPTGLAAIGSTNVFVSLIP